MGCLAGNLNINEHVGRTTDDNGICRISIKHEPHLGLDTQDIQVLGSHQADFFLTRDNDLQFRIPFGAQHSFIQLSDARFVISPQNGVAPGLYDAISNHRFNTSARLDSVTVAAKQYRGLPIAVLGRHTSNQVPIRVQRTVRI